MVLLRGPMPNATKEEGRHLLPPWRGEPWRQPVLIVEAIEGTAATAFINEGWPVPGFTTEEGEVEATVALLVGVG